MGIFNKYRFKGIDIFESYAKFDDIIVMKNGKIVEHGRYSDLINNNSVFKSLVDFND